MSRRASADPLNPYRSPSAAPPPPDASSRVSPPCPPRRIVLFFRALFGLWWAIFGCGILAVPIVARPPATNNASVTLQLVVALFGAALIGGGSLVCVYYLVRVWQVGRRSSPAGDRAARPTDHASR